MILVYAIIILIILALIFRRDLSALGRFQFRGGWKLVVAVLGLNDLDREQAQDAAAEHIQDEAPEPSGARRVHSAVQRTRHPERLEHARNCRGQREAGFLHRLHQNQVQHHCPSIKMAATVRLS